VVFEDKLPDEKNDKEEEKTLPNFQEGEEGPHEASLAEKWTSPPKPYTEATLLRAMETAGKNVEDEVLREAMKENGIGRPSTRASIIETLLKRDYIRKERKNLIATDTGIQLIQTIQQDLLKSAELTGQWEKKLRDIEKGEYKSQAFMQDLKHMVSEVVFAVKNDKTGELCPLCRQGRLIRGKQSYGCSRWKEGCSYRAPF
ncbi:MAG: DNA topoisomerase III, partial [Bacteroidales bacterium]|nr:DNA topoisomerase III [Bacteroidales bacterium]